MVLLNLGPNGIKIIKEYNVDKTKIIVYDQIVAGDIDLYEKKSFWTDTPINDEYLGNKRIKVNCDPSLISKNDVLFSMQDTVKLEITSAKPEFKEIECKQIIVANKPKQIDDTCFIPKKLSIIELSNNVCLNVDRRIYSEYLSRTILDKKGEFYGDHSFRKHNKFVDVFSKQQRLFLNDDELCALRIYTKHNFGKLKEDIIKDHEKIKQYWNKKIEKEKNIEKIF